MYGSRVMINFVLTFLQNPGVDKIDQNDPEWPQKMLIMDDISVFCIFQSVALMI